MNLKLTSKLLTLVLIGLCCSLSNTYAGHSAGVEITYRCIDSLVYEVTIRGMRDCRGTSYAIWSGDLRVKVGSGSVLLSPSLISITDVTPVCDSVKKPCYPQNTKGTGSGLEIHVYRDTVDFTSSRFSGLLKNGCSVYFEFSRCCRNGAISTGAGNKNLYSYAYLDICKAPENSSPVYSTPSKFQACCNQPLFMNIGALDTFEHDSLSFAIGYPLSCLGCPISYTSSYPITAYYPASLKPPYYNIGANPPIGIYLDPENGNFILTPTKCNEITALVFEVTEWRKDTSGKYRKIGITRQDVTFSVNTCPNNNPPIIRGPYQRNICVGEKICFNIYTDDKVFVPPPPLPKPDPDTVTISWNGGIPGATFKVINDSALHQTGQFCWTPKEEDYKPFPHQFVVTVKDDQCPLRAVSSMAINVLVKPRAKGSIEIEKLSCNRIVLSSKTENSYNRPNQHQWVLFDTSGNPLVQNPRTDPYFTNGKSVTTKASDTLSFQVAGTYVIRHTVNNSARCDNIYWDTIRVDSVFEARLASQNDTFHCAKESIVLQPNLSFEKRPVSEYQWSTGDSAGMLNLQLSDSTEYQAIGVEVWDDNGCYARDEIVLFKRPHPTVSMPSHDYVCFNDTVLLTPDAKLAHWKNPSNGDTIGQGQGSSLDYSWTLNQTPISSDSFMNANKPGTYILTISDSLSCSASDTFVLRTLDFRADAGPDQSICDGQAFDLELDYFDSIKRGTTSAYYKWFEWDDSSKSEISDTSWIIDEDKTLELVITLIDGSLDCVDKDTINIGKLDLPFVYVRDSSICCLNDALDLKELETENSSGGKWWVSETEGALQNSFFQHNLDCDTSRHPSHITLHYAYTDSTSKCVNFDSSLIEIRPNTYLGLTDRTFCSSGGPISADADKLTASTVEYKWNSTNGYNSTWECFNCTVEEWDSIYHRNPENPIPVLNIQNSIISPIANKARELGLKIEYINSFKCKSSDTLELTILGNPMIDRQFFRSGTPTIVCSEDEPFELAIPEYPAMWKLVYPNSIRKKIPANDRLRSDTLDEGYYRLIMDAGEKCPADSIDLKIEKNYPLNILPKDTSLISREDHTEFIKVTNNYQGTIRWGVSLGSLESSHGISNVIFLPYHRGDETLLVQVDLHLSDEPQCMDITRDTMLIELRPDPCSDFSFKKVEMALIVEAEQTDLASYSWLLDDGRTAKGVQTSFQNISFSEPFYVHLLTTSSKGDTCTRTQYIDFSHRSDLKLKVGIYPNPVEKNITIHGGDFEYYSITNHLGQELKGGTPINDEINCEGLSKGSYQLILINSDVIHRTSFIYLGD